MAKKGKQGSATLPVALPQSLELAGDRIVPLQYFRVKERHPKGDGPWNDEADKIGWVDEGTVLHCIILRERDGTLSGFVGVQPDHPLYDFEADAVPAGIGISVHGGLNYAKPCEANVPEQISVCHVPSNAELRRTRARRRGQIG